MLEFIIFYHNSYRESTMKSVFLKIKKSTKYFFFPKTHSLTKKGQDRTFICMDVKELPSVLLMGL